MDRISEFRVSATASGLSSEIAGGSFGDGFKQGLGMSAFTYANVRMRGNMIANSLLDKTLDDTGRKVNDGTGLSRGLFGDLFKLGGGRYNPLKPLETSPLGGRQNGLGSIFGFGYARGSLRDMVVESFAGPHDMANSHWFYEAINQEHLGSIMELSGFQSTLRDMTTNWTTSLMFAAPFAASAMAEQTNYSAYQYLDGK